MDFKPIDQGLKFLGVVDFISFHLCYHVFRDRVQAGLVKYSKSRQVQLPALLHPFIDYYYQGYFTMMVKTPNYY